MPSTPDPDVCPKCGAAFESDLCVGCELVVAKPVIQEQILDQRLPILVVLFCVMGVLGLPLLWLSPAFRRRTKVILTIVVVIYTGLLATAAWMAGSSAWQSWLEFVNS